MPTAPILASGPALGAPGPVALVTEAVVFTLAAFAGVQLLLLAAFGFDMVAEVFGPDTRHVDALKALLTVASAAAAWFTVRPLLSARPAD